MILTLLIRFWKPLALVLVLAGLYLWLQHERSEAFQRGYDKALAENEQALRDWQIAYDRKVKADADRLRQAQDDYTREIARLNALRAQPVPRVVCRRADRPRDVPATSGLPASEAPDTGALPERASESFDPTPDLERIANEADDILAQCRQLHQAVHGVATSG